MAIGPHGMFALWGARRVKQTLLREEHKRLFWMLAMPDLSFGSCDFRQCATGMYRCSARAFGCPPGYGAIQGKVKLEDAWPIAISLQLVLVAGRQARTADAQQLLRSDIAQDGARGGKHRKGLDLNPGDDFASQRTQVGCHRVDDLLRPSARQRPANCMPKRPQHKSGRRAGCPFKCQHGVTAHTRENSARVFALKLAFRQTTR